MNNGAVPATEVPVSRREREARLRQRGHVIWFFGLSGAGKSTLATRLGRELHESGIFTGSLDGDDLRKGLNQGLGFSDADRSENLRRAAEVARLMVGNGLVTVCAFITPRRAQRALVRSIIGAEDVTQVFVSASVTTCARRDPKGLYARAQGGQIAQFTGIGSEFEPPAADEPVLTIDTEAFPPETCVRQLLEHFGARLRAAP